MSSKKTFRPKKPKQPQQFLSKRPKNTWRPSPDGLLPGEVGVIFDPHNPGRVHSYMLPDGTQVRLNNDSVPSKVPSLEPSLMVTSMENRSERNTLAYRFGDMMIVAQNLFGPRSTSFLFLGFEFIPDHARVRYVTDYSMVIQLSFRAMINPMAAYFELAHECIHLLSPHPYKPVTILEEGMATVFSVIYLRDTMKVPSLPTEQKYYEEAATLVAMLLETDPYGIRKIREEQPDTRKIDKTLIQKYYPTIPEVVAAQLVRPFLNGVKDSPDVVAQYNS